MKTIEAKVAHAGDLQDGQMKKVRVGRLFAIVGSGAAAEAAAEALRQSDFPGRIVMIGPEFGVSLMYAGHAEDWDEVLVSGDPAERDFTAFYIKEDRLLAAAGTQDKQIAAFMERMRTGRLPTAAELRNQPSADLCEMAFTGR